ncbi:transposase [Actinomadura rubrisoli]|uniref:transposase n=1 Tax=Actinomadura rubrisoli TaxID=2530368 RepID=UPI00244149DE|nr:transposase [Actinomadura rubrisoli]
MDVARLRRTLAELPQPRAPDGRIVLAVHVTPWPRPDANPSPERLFCHVHATRLSSLPATCPPGADPTPVWW